MDKLLNIIPCCRKEEVINSQTNCEINVPIEKNECLDINIQNISFSPDKTELKYLDSPNVKFSEINNNSTLNENHNITNNNTIEDNSNGNSFINNIKFTNNLNDNTNFINENINNNSNKNQTHININKIDTFSLSFKEECQSSKNNNNNKKPPPNSYKNNNKLPNNKKCSDSSKNLSQTNISKINNKNCKESNTNKETVLTLNDLILIQNQEEKYVEIGPKLLLSGELFFWKEIILQTNGIKNSLRKEKDEHVFFGLKNKSNLAGVMYNDLIIILIKILFRIQ